MSLILITNDDGVETEGIRCLAETLSDLGEVVIFAPDGARSGMSAAITCDRPISYRQLLSRRNLTVYSCTGTPVDCVKLAINEILPKKPDLLVSGINQGGNHALSVHYSGTMGAALEGCVFDVPSLGSSLYGFEPDANFIQPCIITKTVAEQILNNGLPHGVYLNLNIPNIRHVKGIRIGRQTDGKWVREFKTETDVDGKILYWITGDYESRGDFFPDNDVELLNSGFASLVPCKIDITDYIYAAKLKELFDKIII